MLSNIIISVPSPKCIVIHDDLKSHGELILRSILRHHLILNKYDVQCFGMQNPPTDMTNLLSYPKFTLHNDIPDKDSWDPKGNRDCMELLKSHSGVVAIHSFYAFVYEYGIRNMYATLLHMMKRPDIVQIILVIHTDLFVDPTKVINSFDALSDLSISFVAPKAENPILQYTYKKTPFKVIKKYEHYHFENGMLRSKEIEEPKPKKEVNVAEMIENLSTFKIDLDESEKKSRANLSLPYIKQASTEQKGTANIIYKLDETDDWDEEDPDDDLNI